MRPDGQASTAAGRRVSLTEVAGLLAGLDVIDAHHHLWTYAEPTEPSQFDLLGPGSALPSRYLPADFRADASDITLAGSVELGGYDFDPCELEGIGHGVPSALVPAARLETVEGRAAVQSLAEHPSVRGVRQILNWHPDPRVRFIEDCRLMEDPEWRRGLSTVADLGLSFDLQVYPLQMERAARLVSSYPSLPFVLNHLGMPLGRDAATMAEWRRGLELLTAGFHLVLWVPLAPIGRIARRLMGTRRRADWR